MTMSKEKSSLIPVNHLQFENPSKALFLHFYDILRNPKRDPPSISCLHSKKKNLYCKMPVDMPLAYLKLGH